MFVCTCYYMGRSTMATGRERLAGRGLRYRPHLAAGRRPGRASAPAPTRPSAVAGIVADVLSLRSVSCDVVLVGNDTGGSSPSSSRSTIPGTARCPGPHFSGDAPEHFPPPILKPVILAAKWPPCSSVIQMRALAVTARMPVCRTTIRPSSPGPGPSGAPTFGHRRRPASPRHRAHRSHHRSRRRLNSIKPALIAWSADDVLHPRERSTARRDHPRAPVSR